MIPPALPSGDPAQLLRYRDRQFAAELLAAALAKFDFFSWLLANPGLSEKEARELLGFHERPFDVLLTLCRASGLIENADDGTLSLTTLGKEYMVKDSPWYLGPYYDPISDTQAARDFVTVLKTGKPANWQAKEEGDDWHESMKEDGFAHDFTAIMDSRGVSIGQALAKALKPDLVNRSGVLDVGGGSGVYASCLMSANPELTGVVMEQAPVDGIARDYIRKRGMQDRLTVHTGDFFSDPWPGDHDVVLLSNVLHDWDFPEVERIMAKARDVLPPNGILVIHEAFLNDQKTGPLPVAEYSALLMSITQGKCYTAGEYGEILQRLGFSVGPLKPSLADRGFIVATKQ